MKSDQTLMQHFALVHDGSDQAWQTAYLAIHVAARLGAPIQVWLISAGADMESLAQRAAQLETAGRAAGVTLQTKTVRNFSLNIFASSDGAVFNGVFLPHGLWPDDELAMALLQRLSYPLWVVAGEPKTHSMAVLVDNLSEDRQLILYAASMSQRMSESITALAPGAAPAEPLDGAEEMGWFSIEDFSSPKILSALQQLQIDLLFLGHASSSLVRSLNCTCVVYPALRNA